MSEDAVIAATQNQSADAHTDSREPPRARGSGSALQIETIEVLNMIISDFMAQHTSMPDACCLLVTALDENPLLSAEQCAETYRMYRDQLEEAYATQMRAIAQGDQQHVHPPVKPDPLGEDGAGEPDPDRKPRTPPQHLIQPNSGFGFPLQLRHEQHSGDLKQTTDDEGND